MEMIRLLLLELMHRRRLVVGMFVVISLAATVIGLNWPKSYSSYTTVYVEQDNLLRSLLNDNQGGPRRDTGNRAALVQQILFGRDILRKVAGKGGWPIQKMSPQQAEQLMEDISARTKVTSVGERLLRIEYKDGDPVRAQKVAGAFADAFIAQSAGLKSADSRQAFEFLDAQAAKYKNKLQAIQDRMDAYQKSHKGAAPDAEQKMSERIALLQQQRQKLEQDLREAQIRKEQLSAQLNGQTDSGSLYSSVEDQLQVQLSEMKNKLAELRLTYRDSYPDVRTLKEKIQQTEQRLADVRAGKSSATEQELAQEAVRSSPMYAQLRNDLYAADTSIATLKSRIEDTKALIKEAQQKKDRVAATSSQLADMQRDYEVTKESYQNLLKRREAARVSMNLDQGRQSTGLSIEQPAFRPHQPSGPRFLYFVAGGLFLGLAAPIGMVFGLLQLDPRIRSGSRLTEMTGIPAIGAIPHYSSTKEEVAEIRGIVLSGGLVMAALIAIGTLAFLRLRGLV